MQPQLYRSNTFGSSNKERTVHMSGQTHTPSKKEKYDSYTPRKRYMKEQEQYDNYRNNQFQVVDQNLEQFPSQFDSEAIYNSKIRKQSLTKRQSHPSSQGPANKLSNFFESSFEKFNDSLKNGPLQDITSGGNYSASIRKNKFKSYNESKEVVSKKIIFDDIQNRNQINTFLTKRTSFNNDSKRRYLDLENDSCLTPRKINRNKEENTEINDKLSLIQAKIAKLQRMTPRKSTPRSLRNQECDIQSYQISERDDLKIESVGSSRVSLVSERENQIMSRVSLGRLVEQEECQPQIEVIQDLSFKISSKLRSIIRNFG